MGIYVHYANQSIKCVNGISSDVLITKQDWRNCSVAKSTRKELKICSQKPSILLIIETVNISSGFQRKPLRVPASPISQDGLHDVVSPFSPGADACGSYLLDH